MSVQQVVQVPESQERVAELKRVVQAHRGR